MKNMNKYANPCVVLIIIESYKDNLFCWQAGIECGGIIVAWRVAYRGVRVALYGLGL